MAEVFNIGLVSVSDRASGGKYRDLGIPTLREWLQGNLTTPLGFCERLIADDYAAIVEALRDLTDNEKCPLILTTGGTGPAPRDITPEATLATGGREMPGFGEEMRRVSLRYVPTAILSRQTAVVCGKTLIINLPGQPKAIAQTLDGIFAAVPYCLDLIGAPRLDADPAKISVFRPRQK
ncbi:MAG: molybdopterin adenylyltransferase [Gammaproteobacteria bacterium]